MVRRKSLRQRVFGEIAEAEMMPFAKDDAEESVADGRRADGQALFGGDAGRDEGEDLPVAIDHRERAVLCADEVLRLLDDFLQHDLEGELGSDVEAGAVQREELFVLPLEAGL